MRIIGLIVCAAFLLGCTTQPPAELCPEKRSQVCTMQYIPTCGVIGDYEPETPVESLKTKNYSSPCNACADDKVSAYFAGACPE